MSEDTKQTGTERVGGASALDEALRPAVSNALSGMLDWVLDVKPINEALKHLSPSFRQMSSLLPMAAGYGFAKLPVSLFKNMTVAHFFQDVVVEMARHIDRKIKQAGSVDKVSPGEYADAAHAGAVEAMARKYVVDPMGHLHRADCVRLASFRRPHQQRNDRNGQPVPPPPSQLQEIGIEGAIAQKLQVSPCCFEGVQADVKKAEAPKAEKKFRSPAEVFAAIKPELREKFNAWLKSTDEETRKRLLTLLKHVDSVEEVEALMSVDDDLREDMLALCENTNASLKVSNFLGLAASALKSGAKDAKVAITKAWEAYKKFDASLAPTVEKLEKDLKKPLRRRPWWHMFLPV
ncbi:MAG TPA: hypothetical protein VL500_06295 [Candidatus Eisenbacteria bacterium]|jgi:hypothetical protein|nr:hypothetical protein [Candidatus Eisenbacteria bacterium]